MSVQMQRKAKKAAKAAAAAAAKEKKEAQLKAKAKPRVQHSEEDFTGERAERALQAQVPRPLLLPTPAQHTMLSSTRLNEEQTKACTSHAAPPQRIPVQASDRLYI